MMEGEWPINCQLGIGPKKKKKGREWATIGIGIGLLFLESKLKIYSFMGKCLLLFYFSALIVLSFCSPLSPFLLTNITSVLFIGISYKLIWIIPPIPFDQTHIHAFVQQIQHSNFLVPHFNFLLN